MEIECEESSLLVGQDAMQTLLKKCVGRILNHKLDKKASVFAGSATKAFLEDLIRLKNHTTVPTNPKEGISPSAEPINQVRDNGGVSSYIPITQIVHEKHLLKSIVNRWKKKSSKTSQISDSVKQSLLSKVRKPYKKLSEQKPKITFRIPEPPKEKKPMDKTDAEIERLRWVFKQMENRFKEMKEHSKEKQKQGINLTDNELCTKFGLRKEDKNKIHITYDFNGRLLIVPRNNKKYNEKYNRTLPICYPKLQFLVKEAEENKTENLISHKNTYKTVDNTSEFSENKINIQNINLRNYVTKSELRPNYGVSLTLNGEHFNGGEFNKSPDCSCKNQMSMREYNTIIGLKPETRKYSTIGGNTTPQELKTQVESSEKNKNETKIFENTQYVNNNEIEENEWKNLIEKVSVKPKIKVTNLHRKYASVRQFMKDNRKSEHENSYVYVYNQNIPENTNNAERELKLPEAIRKRTASVTPNKTYIKYINNAVKRNSPRRLRDEIAKKAQLYHTTIMKALPPPPLGYTIGHGILPEDN